MIERYTGGFVQTNGYLISTPGGSHLLIDAPLGVSQWLRAKSIRPAAVLLTHQHYDHVEDAAELAAEGIPIYARESYALGLTLVELVRSMGMPINLAPYRISHVLGDAPVLHLEGLDIGILFIPGHSQDSIAFHLPDRGEVFSGDTLMAGGLGRCDFPGGSFELLVNGIRTKLLSLPPETRVFPGHGPATTIGAEDAGNPYLKG